MVARSRFPGLREVVERSRTEAAATNNRFASTVRSFRVTVSGHIVDDDGIGGTDEIDYNWAITETIVPGGAPFKRYDAAEADQEVRFQWDLAFSMDASERLFIAGTLQLFEGTPSNKDLVRQEVFGPVTIDRGTEREVVNVRLEDDEGDSATCRIVVANNL